MKNGRFEGAPRTGSIGPRPGVPSRPLSEAATAILDLLRLQSEALTLAALAHALRLHPNTVREHLDVLVRRGFVVRRRAEPEGRGRPAWLYEVADDAAETQPYAGLAVALAEVISRNSPAPRHDAVAAGEDWGRGLACDRGAGAMTPGAARTRVIKLIDDLGFEPRQDPTDRGAVLLTRCPLLQAAHRHPDVVCAVHLGIVRGALAAYGVDPAGTELEPFARPGSCQLMLPQPQEGA